MPLQDIHPTLKLVIILLVALLARSLDWSGLITMVGLAAILLGRQGGARWLRLLARMKWLFLVMLLVYALNTPGQYIADLAYSPTYEGLGYGVTQMLYLVALTGWLLWMQLSTPKPEQILAIYQILVPLGVSRSLRAKIAVRCALALAYAEAYLEDGKTIKMSTEQLSETLRRLFDASMSSHENNTEQISIAIPIWKTKDSILLFALILLGGVYAISAWY